MDYEVFIARLAPDNHPFWANNPESIGVFSEEEIQEGKHIEEGG